MLDWELGDAIFWVAFDEEKPFPVCVYRNDGSWCHKYHPYRTLTTEEKHKIERFAQERIADCMQSWKPNMQTRLHWSIK